MKFKIIFLFFNLVIVLSFFVVFFMPLFMLGHEYAAIFWRDSWYLPIIFFLIIGGIDSYFLLNWRLFRNLEDENWDGVIAYLEDRLYQRGRISGQKIRILINAYLLKNNMQGIDRLESHLREHYPRLHSRFLLSLGIPRLLRTDAEGLEFFFGPHRDETRKDKEWINFLYGFSLLMQVRREEAMGHFVSMIHSGYVGPTVRLLLLYSLAPFTVEQDDVASLVSAESAEMKKRYSRPALEKEIQRSREQVVPVILAKLTEDALNWLYPSKQEIEKEA
ncbi:hypothetical protein [Sediminispirochaeta bajacaliforniensis]|uniref:hypothetical protein n=1 Tax=Sediminispirochaeta bajacaliforniensis TaxID=148 RepID=UPI000361FDDE|nr:hypothetical protein [Sediminispirochaeta bajacaliforniensis]